MVHDVLGDHSKGLIRVGGPSGRFGTGRGTLGEVGKGRGTLREVRDGSWDPQRDPKWVRGPSGRSGTGRGTLGEV